MTASVAIETFNLRKDFGFKTAVRGLSLSVPRGEVFGFLGPNGAGKTTSVKMLLGLVKPTDGTANLLGMPFSNAEVRRKIGYLPEHFRFAEWLTGEEFLAYNGKLFDIPENIIRPRIDALLDMVGLKHVRYNRIQTYSKGMQQRIGLAHALINDPDLIFLDEPTSGLDPGGRRMVRDIIHNLKSQGKTIFLNSHFLSEVEITCDRVVFIKKGEVLQSHTIKDMQSATIEVDIRADGVSPDIISELSGFSSEVTYENRHIILSLSGEEKLPEIIKYLVRKDVSIYEVKPKHVSLEDRFLEILGTEGESK